MKSFLKSCTALAMAVSFSGQAIAQEMKTEVGDGEGQLSRKWEPVSGQRHVSQQLIEAHGANLKDRDALQIAQNAIGGGMESPPPIALIFMEREISKLIR